MRIGYDRSIKHLLHKRRWAIMSRYPVWDDEWVHRLSDEDAHCLLRIFEAIRRLDMGTYGICTVCGSAIDYERLSALPEAQACDVCVHFAAPTLAAVH